MYPNTIDKAYVVLCKYNIPANSTCLPRKCADVSFISRETENRLVYLLMVPMKSFTGMACDTTVIGLFTTVVNAIYLISVVPAQSPSCWVINFLRPTQFRNT